MAVKGTIWEWSNKLQEFYFNNNKWSCSKLLGFYLFNWLLLMEKNNFLINYERVDRTVIDRTFYKSYNRVCRHIVGVIKTASSKLNAFTLSSLS